MKIAVLCNSLMGVASVQSLAQSGVLAGLGIPNVPHEATDVLQELARQMNIPLTRFQKEGFEEDCMKWLEATRPDSVWVLTFPFMISRRLLDAVPGGFLNFHFGLLPQYRGADAIFWEIRNREPFGAVTVHRMESRLDTGPVLLMEKVPLSPMDTYGTHMGNLAMVGMQVCTRLLSQWMNTGQLPAGTPQDESLAKEWPKPGMKEVAINWEQMEADDVVALIRACNPWNKGAYTFLGNSSLRIILASVSDVRGDGPPGTLFSPEPESLHVVCKGSNSLKVEAVYLDAGFFSVGGFLKMGVKPGMKFVLPHLG